jgi:protein TonB
MKNSPQQRVSIAIFATLLLHTSLAYAIYEIESKVIVKEVFSSDMHLVSLDEVKKEDPSVLQVKQEEKQQEKPEPQISKKIKQKAVPHKMNETVSEKKNSTSLVLKTQTNPSLGIKQSVEEYRENSTYSIKKTQEEPYEQIENYLSKIRVKIQSNLKYTHLARKLKLEGESIIEFVILNNGYIDELSIAIKQSSGHESLDKQAIKTLLSLLPFEIPPKDNMTIILPVVFQLNKN